MAKATQLDRAVDLLRQGDAVVTPISDGFAVARPSDDSKTTLGFLSSLYRCGREFVLFDRVQSTLYSERRFVFVASSRLPQKLDQIPSFFDGLLKLAVQLDPGSDVLLTGKDVACDAMVRRVSHLFDVACREIEPIECSAAKISRTLRTFESQMGCLSKDCKTLVFDFENLGRDATLALLADQVIVLSMRKNGNLHSAVKLRLQAGGPTRVLLDRDLVARKLQDELLGAGAAGWFLFAANNSDEFPQPSNATNTADKSPLVLSLSDFQMQPKSKTFLLHWTRRRVGPWPNQSSDEFLDDLIFHSSRNRHGRIDVLRRILATQRLLADNHLTRAEPVVCFSDIGLDDLKQRRVFRNHLSRWDFEPCGLAICRDWIANRGGRAVRYGGEEDWKSLAESDQAFFQRASSENGKIDWTQEREWRVRGDVDLRTVPEDSAFAFVPTRSDAERIAEFCRWPIVVMDE